jgi:uncharacterized protein DUF4232
VNHRTQLLALASMALVVAACGGSSSPSASPGPSSPATASTAETASGDTACRTSALSLRLGAGGAAAGSSYRPIVFTNTGSGTCTMFGYPGVAYVAGSEQHQVGAPAARNQQHPPSSVTLRPGEQASAVLQIVDAHNYPPASCRLVAVSGLRVYPPDETAAAFVALPSGATACSTDVSQLTVQATVAGTGG